MTAAGAIGFILGFVTPFLLVWLIFIRPYS